MPRHVNPTSPSRKATAPYNFVPLPERVFTVADGIDVGGEKIKPWEMHDRYVPGTHSGWIDLEIETLTPLFVRSAVARRDDDEWDSRDARLRPEPCTTPDGRPAIPGSSLRGMVRTLVEILAFAKIQPVSRAKPFFGTVAPDRIGRAYGERMRRGEGVQGGFVQRQGDAWGVQPCEVLRVEHSMLPSELHVGNMPSWDYQQKECWLRDAGDRVSQITFDPPSGNGWKHGVLVLTGLVPRKRREFVFLDPSGDSRSLTVPEAVWDRFHDEDQITQWQERAFPQDRPTQGCRRAPGHLRDGEPVFFVRDDQATSDANPDGLIFLGRAGMFRFPYDLDPADLVRDHLASAGLDLADAMFGRVAQDGAIKGRVFFEDAVATSDGPDWFEEIMVPRILSAPKPTTFQHYLTQDGTGERHQLTTYLTGDHTTIRGHKLYWHRWDEARGLGLVKESSQHAELLRDLQSQQPGDRQHTIIRPVKAGVEFESRIRFENLTDMELGALLSALDLPEGCAHRLGMGKPLGLGSVRITARLRLVDRRERYRSWRGTGVQDDENGQRFRNAFVTTILAHARGSNETLLQRASDLRQIARLDALFHLLAWAPRPGTEATEYMELARFRERLVLPTPHGVVGDSEPPWPQDPPRPGSDGPETPRRRDGGRSRGRATGRRQPTRREPRAIRSTQEPKVPTAPPAPKPKPVERGQTRSGTLKKSEGRWVAVFEGDAREAEIINPGAIPANSADGTVAEFYITEQSKRAGIRARFERTEES